MISFKELGITPSEQKTLTGDKIKMSKILNKPITVHDFRIVDSKYTDKGNGKCLHMQIGIGDVKHVVFTGATGLMETMQKIGKERLPFSTTIVEENDRYEFT